MSSRSGRELTHRVADVGAGGFTAMRRSRLVAQSVGEQAEDFALPLCQQLQLLYRLAAREDAREDGST